MAVITNRVELQGRLNRIDVREGLSKAGAEFVSVTFTLDVDGNQIRVESFSMKHNKNGDESKSYQGLMTIFNEGFALHKTVKKVGDDQATPIEDETIVEDINECDAIRFSNYGSFKYCRFEENVYAKEGELVKNIRLQGAYPNRVDESKREYTPTADFEISGVVRKAPMMVERNEVECMEMTVEVPIYVEAYGDREASVTLHEITVRTMDEEVFGYLEDNFELGSVVYLNGRIVREVQRVEIEALADDEGRGFGRKIKREPQYKTDINEYYEILGGYLLDEDEIEDTRAFDRDIWKKATQAKKEKEQEMLEGGEKPKQVGFGKASGNAKKNPPIFPF